MITNTIRILDIVEDTTVDGPGLRTSIYASGCPHNCKGCHNPQSWNIEEGTEWAIEALLDKIKVAEFADVSFSGGDPLMQPEQFCELARRIRSETDKSIWCYTGYLWEQIIASARLSPILQYLDVVVDGPYIDYLRDESLLFSGSSNQRLIDVQTSITLNTVVLWQRAATLAGSTISWSHSEEPKH